MLKKTALFLLSSVILAACTLPSVSPQTPGSSDTGAKTQTQTKSDITISSSTFSVGIVAPGQVVSVINNDSVPHTVTSDDGKTFNTGTINPGASATFMAPFTGSYGFHCNFHKSMISTLEVK